MRPLFSKKGNKIGLYGANVEQFVILLTTELGYLYALDDLGGAQVNFVPKHLVEDKDAVETVEPKKK